MLELKLYGASRYGKKRPDYSYYTDDRFRKDWTPGIHQFVLDQKVRYMHIIKHGIENLEAFPVFLICDENVTPEILPKFIEALEHYIGKLEYTHKREQKEKGVLQYLQENGVEIQ